MFCLAKSQTNLRNRITSLVALLFVVYALADVSVLQVYCGNEALGIPPVHHSASPEGLTYNIQPEMNFVSDGTDSPKVPDDHQYDHLHECFCWQQVVVGFYFFDTIRLSEERENRSLVFHDAQHTDSDLSLHLRPPQIA